MTPKEKAEELVEKYRDVSISFVDSIEGTCDMRMNNEDAKECALIAVDEMMKEIRNYDVFLHHESAKDFMKLNSIIETNLLSYLNYLQEVKQEIELL
jgi:hypothetical protein